MQDGRVHTYIDNSLMYRCSEKKANQILVMYTSGKSLLTEKAYQILVLVTYQRKTHAQRKKASQILVTYNNRKLLLRDKGQSNIRYVK